MPITHSSISGFKVSSLISQLVKITALAAFLAVLIVLPYQQWLGNPTENRENRELAEKPSLPMTSTAIVKFPKRFSEYMDDHFGFRGDLLRIYHRLLVSIGTSPSEKVVIGKSGWLFYTNQELTDQNRGALPLSDRWLLRYKVGFESQRKWLEKRNIKHLLLPTPDKNTLYPEYMPDWVKWVGPSRYKQTLGYLSANAEPYVNVLPALEAAKSRNERIYLQTDTHWSCLGGFRAYETLLDEVDKLNLPGVERLAESDIRFTPLEPTPGGDMARNLLLLDDILREGLNVECEIKNLPELTATRVSDGFVAKNPLLQRQQQQRWQYRKGDGEVRTSVLLFRDSYSHVLIPYLAVTFDELVVVPRPRIEFDRAEIKRFKPDLVIYQFVERALFWVPRIKRDG